MAEHALISYLFIAIAHVNKFTRMKSIRHDAAISKTPWIKLARSASGRLGYDTIMDHYYP